ncbi:MAG: hypothetical protein FWF07_01290 [Methanomassiliicoccaceae archaeon]|nr:hypothetical protein [Methanomassiliicoccaceae archaeon]
MNEKPSISSFLSKVRELINDESDWILDYKNPNGPTHYCMFDKDRNVFDAYVQGDMVTVFDSRMECVAAGVDPCDAPGATA